METKDKYTRSRMDTGVRRTSGAPQRPARSYKYADHTAQKRTHGKVAATIIVLLLIAIVGFVAWWVTGNGGIGDSFNESKINSSTDSIDGTKAASAEPDESMLLPVKLRGSEETVDENGVVHGTTPDGIDYVLYGRGTKSNDGESITLAAVGDNMGTDMNLPVADRFEGTTGDNLYNFKPFYTEVKEYLADFDLALINQETMTAGTDNGRVYEGYPEFNTPETVIDAIADANFNIVNMGSNHTWDQGEEGILRTHEELDRFPEIMVIGSYLSKDDRDTVRLEERNGKTVAFLGYTYGDNHYYTADEFPNTYYSCPFEKDVMKTDIQRAQQVADAVVVYVHWGTEYTSIPNDQQLDYAQFLADLDVDLVIGSHAHIIQPVKILEAASGKKVPVVYGLGNFACGWDTAEYILSGMFTCDISWNEEGEAQIGDMVWHNMIEWSDGNDHLIRFMKDMDAETMNKNRLTPGAADDATYFKQKVESVDFDIKVE